MNVMNGFGDWFRAVIGLSSIVIFFLLLWRITRVWRRYSESQRIIFFALLFYTFGLAWRSWDLILQRDLPFSASLVPIFIANTIMLAYLLESRRQYEKRVGEDLHDPP